MESDLDFSKLKLELYDFLGIVFPGLLLVCEGWILLRGWPQFVASVNRTSGTGLTLLIIVAFGFGNIVQELGDVVVKFVKGKRYFKEARDRFWKTEEAILVKDAIKKEFGREIESADAAFDYCLTKLDARFAKRDVFIATSDLCRSFVVLALVGLLPAARIAFWDVAPLGMSLKVYAAFLATLFAVVGLAWERMRRFRELADVTVFRSYLATTERRT